MHTSQSQKCLLVTNVYVTSWVDFDTQFLFLFLCLFCKFQQRAVWVLISLVVSKLALIPGVYRKTSSKLSLNYCVDQ